MQELEGLDQEGKLNVGITRDALEVLEFNEVSY